MDIDENWETPGNYDIHGYGAMVADHGRTDAYARALRDRLTPDSVVLDIGAGPGILTLLACQAGARKVYAVESDGIIEVARESVARNGYTDRVELIQAFSTAIDLPEKVDVIVSDLHGVFPFYADGLTSLIDARNRFLKPGGFMIPMRETVSVVVVAAPDAYEWIVGPWESTAGFDGTAARQRSLCTWMRMRCAPEQLLVEPKVWSVLDYLDLQSPSARGQVSWTIANAGQGHGVCVWFDCETAPGLGFSNSPLSGERHVYMNGFFPWSEPCQLEAGDQVDIEIRVDMVQSDLTFSWNTVVRGPGSPGPVKAWFRQSELQGTPISADWLRKSDASFVPSPNREADIDKLMLDLLFEGLSLEEMSQRVSERFPDRFPTWRDALVRVGDMSRRYSR